MSVGKLVKRIVNGKEQVSFEQRGIRVGDVAVMPTATPGIAFCGVVERLLFRPDRARNQYGQLIVERVRLRNQDVCITVNIDQVYFV